jgi:ABC-type multidrug transport system ATPase subunit
MVVLSAGQLAFVGSVDELRGADGLRYEVRVKDGEEKLAQALRAAGCTVEIAASGRGGIGRPLFVRLPESAGTDVVFDAAAGAGVQVRQLQPQRASLEDAFLRAVGAAPGAP